MSQQSRPTSKLMLMSRSGCGRMADVALARARDLTPRPRADTFYVRCCTFYVYTAHFMFMLHIFVCSLQWAAHFLSVGWHFRLSYSANHFTTWISFIWFLTLVNVKGSQITCGNFFLPLAFFLKHREDYFLHFLLTKMHEKCRLQKRAWGAWQRLHGWNMLERFKVHSSVLGQTTNYKQLNKYWPTTCWHLIWS